MDLKWHLKVDKNHLNLLNQFQLINIKIKNILIIQVLDNNLLEEDHCRIIMFTSDFNLFIHIISFFQSNLIKIDDKYHQINIY